MLACDMKIIIKYHISAGLNLPLPQDIGFVIEIADCYLIESKPVLFYLSLLLADVLIQLMLSSCEDSGAVHPLRTLHLSHISSLMLAWCKEGTVSQVLSY